MRKKYIMLLLNSFFFLCFSYGQNTKNLALSYNPDDFIYDYNSSNELIIKSYKHTVTYDSDTLKPALPYISFHFLIDKNMDFDTINYQATDSCIFENVKLQANPKIIPTNVKNTGFSQRIVEYDEAVYPNKNVLYHGTHIMDGYKMVTLSVCPYIYDNMSKRLRLITTLDIALSLKPAASTRNVISPYIGTAMRSVVNNLICNKEDLDTYYPSASTYTSRSTNAQNTKYVIITCDSLVSSFQPLADWKTIKGLEARIITTEYIFQNYNDSTPQLKIKRCLKNLKENHGLEYVLLGGDDQIVPVQYCRAKVVTIDTNISDDIPTDMFYSNFDGSFEWDANKNYIIGEIDDNVDFMSEIFLSRVPIRTKKDAEAFVNKVLNYEQNPPIENWKNKILMSGVKMLPEDENIFGIEAAKGDIIYNQYINNTNYWNGTMIRYYDTVSDVIEDSDVSYPSVSGINRRIEEGYAFINLMCHGFDFTWVIDESYKPQLALELNNSQPTIITTSACYPNAFDNSRMSLSEGLIRGRNNGIIAFVGNSRLGFCMQDNTGITSSDLFTALFYRTVFSNNSQNFSKAFILSKQNASFLNSLSQINRYLQYGLNAIGDPEMPIYPSFPKTLDSLVIDTIYNGAYIITGERYDTSTITITGENTDGGDYFLQTTLHNPNINNIFYNDFPNPSKFYITRPGYVPFVFTINDKKIYLQNRIHNGRHHIKSNSFVIGKDVIDNNFNGPVKVTGGNLNIKYKDNVTINKDFEVKRGATLSISKK